MSTIYKRFKTSKAHTEAVQAAKEMRQFLDPDELCYQPGRTVPKRYAEPVKKTKKKKRKKDDVPVEPLPTEEVVLSPAGEDVADFLEALQNSAASSAQGGAAKELRKNAF